MKLVEFTMADRNVPVHINAELVTYCFANADRPGTVTIFFAPQQAINVIGSQAEIVQILQTGRYVSEEDKARQTERSRAALNSLG